MSKPIEYRRARKAYRDAKIGSDEEAAAHKEMWEIGCSMSAQEWEDVARRDQDADSALKYRAAASSEMYVSPY